jgi:DNA polymerase
MSLNLDQRQRAMLEEMGVKLWWPQDPEAMPSADAQTFEVVADTPQIATQTIANKRLLTDGNHLSSSPHQPPAVQPPSHLAAQSTQSMDWSTLQATVTSCAACSLCKTRKNTVFGVGQADPTPGQAPQVDWMIVGEAPGEHEDIQGEPFVGAAGKLLDNMLKAMGCSREHNVYIANVLKCRPPGNRNPAPEEITQCAPYLERQVALLRPKVIVAMGRFAVQTLLADSVPQVQTIPLGKLRGQVFSYQGVPVIVTYHPAYLLRSLQEKAKSWADLCLAMAVMTQNTPQG